MFSKYFKKQKPMRTVLIALAPIILLGIYTFGWKTLALLAVNIIVACGVEYICEKKMYKRTQITEAAIVTATLYTLTLSPLVPLWQSAIGAAFAIFFGKEVFGGYARNPFNPALVGRAFMYINFPNGMTIYTQATNADSFINGLGGFTKWMTPIMDATSGPTPMNALKNTGESIDTLSMFLGNHAGSIGEISILLILLGGAYMIYKKVASWEIMVASLIGFVGSSYLFLILGIEGNIMHPLEGMLVGGFMFGTVFMSTDPISSPNQKQAKWIYGILIGVLVVTIRSFSLFQGGMMFAILIASVFSPIIDYVFKGINKKKREKAKLAKAKEA